MFPIFFPLGGTILPLVLHVLYLVLHVLYLVLHVLCLVLHVLYFESEKDFSQYAAPVFQPSGVPGESQLVLTDGGGWMDDGWWMDGQRKSKKIMYFKNFSKTVRYFFLVVSRPLRRVLKTFSEKNSKKIKNF